MTTRCRLLKLAPICLSFVWLGAAGHAADVTASAAKPAEVRAPDAAAWELAKNYHRENGGKALVVMHAGKIIFEDYANGGRAEKPEPIASGSKGFVGVAAIAAVEDGILRLDDPVCGAIEPWAGDPEKSKITYRQLLTLTSGLQARAQGGGWKVPSWKEVVAFPLTGKPGAQFVYGEAQMIAFAYALQQKLHGETFEAYLKRRVLDPIGIRATWALKCADGRPQVAGGALITARDWVKYGEFVRLRGLCSGKQIIAARLFDEFSKTTEQNPAYGLAWWVPRQRGEEDYAWFPEMIAARGAGDQRLFVIPPLELVIARQASLDEAQKRRFDETNLLSLALRGKADPSAGKRRSRGGLQLQ